MMATGQRVQEIVKLTNSHYDRLEHLLIWQRTKYGLPHSLPLPEVAIEILDNLVGSASGFFFPHRDDPPRHALYTTPNKLCEVSASETDPRRLTPRDRRRTWKTLAGPTGSP